MNEIEDRPAEGGDKIMLKVSQTKVVVPDFYYHNMPLMVLYLLAETSSNNF